METSSPPLSSYPEVMESYELKGTLFTTVRGHRGVDCPRQHTLSPGRQSRPTQAGHTVDGCEQLLWLELCRLSTKVDELLFLLTLVSPGRVPFR